MILQKNKTADEMYRAVGLWYNRKSHCFISGSELPLESFEIHLLKGVALFEGLKEDQIEVIRLEARRIELSRDAYLFYQGDSAERVHVLLEGSIKLTQVTLDGQQVLMRYIQPGEAFTILAALDGIEYPASAQATLDSEILAWDRATFQALMLKYPRIALNVLDVVAVHMREFQDRLRELATERVERRLARTLLRLANQAGQRISEGVLINLPLSRQDLAEMTGTTLYTVSRTLSQWENQGLVRSSREKVIILKPHGLVTIAEDLPR